MVSSLWVSSCCKAMTACHAWSCSFATAGGLERRCLCRHRLGRRLANVDPIPLTRPELLSWDSTSDHRIRPSWTNWIDVETSLVLCLLLYWFQYNIQYVWRFSVVPLCRGMCYKPLCIVPISDSGRRNQESGRSIEQWKPLTKNCAWESSNCHPTQTPNCVSHHLFQRIYYIHDQYFLVPMHLKWKMKHLLQ